MREVFFYFLDRYNYYIVFFLFFVSLFSVILKKNLIQKLISLSIFQSSVIFIYLSIGFDKDANYPVIIDNKKLPILSENKVFYNNPLPHVLMLTAIVVGVSTFALGLSIILAISKVYARETDF